MTDFLPGDGFGDDGPDPNPPPALDMTVFLGVDDTGVILDDIGLTSLGSFVQNTVRTFSLFVKNTSETTGFILTIFFNGFSLSNGSSGSINNNPSVNGLSLSQGEGVVINIIINTSVVGNKSITLSIAADDPPTYFHTFNFTIDQVSVSDPTIALVYNNNQIQTNSVVSLGAFPEDDVSDISFQILNYAVPSLIVPQNGITITTIGGSESLIVNPSSSNSITLSFNDSSTFKVRLDTSSLGNKTAVVSIASNDPTKNPFAFTISYSIAKAFDFIVKDSSREFVDGESISLGSFDRKSIISRNITMSNRGISSGIRLLNIFGDGDVTLSNIPSLPFVLQPNEANAVQFIARFSSSIVGVKDASLQIQWEVS